MQRTKYIIILLTVVLCLQQQAMAQKNKVFLKRDPKNKSLDIDIWPVFYGGLAMLLTPTEGPAPHWPGYGFSGGLTLNVYDPKTTVFAFTDALYSFRAYDGHSGSEAANYIFSENTADIAIGAGFNCIYGGAYIQIPMGAELEVKDWSKDDFKGIGRTTSVAFMAGYRLMGRHLGADFRFLLGQGPGQFLEGKSVGDSWLTQISIGIMGGF